MKYECCSIQKLRFEIESWFQDLKKNERLEIKITRCPVLKRTYDLKILKHEK